MLALILLMPLIYLLSYSTTKGEEDAEDRMEGVLVVASSSGYEHGLHIHN